MSASFFVNFRENVKESELVLPTQPEKYFTFDLLSTSFIKAESWD